MTDKPAIPAGWTLVPREPADGMIEAGQEVVREAEAYGGRIYASAVYDAMLDAAPVPPASIGDSDDPFTAAFEAYLSTVVTGPADELPSDALERQSVRNAIDTYLMLAPSISPAEHARVVALSDALVRDADNVSERLLKPGWRPSRSDVESLRNLARQAAAALKGGA